MSGFTALNVEPEDVLEEEIDDTKEIQIEEAFKLYQNALKLHSQGPDFYDAAEEAYNELFQSEVFKYPEVVTDYGHEQLDDTVPAPNLIEDQVALPILTSSTADTAANSLPQLIYLSYKNRGQFVLDVARHNLDTAASDRKSVCLYYYEYCLKSLEDSASALERDDTDLDLWKKAARVSDVLSSQRLVRFCLESVLAGDEETGDQSIDLSGLDEAFASGELEQVLELLQDDINLSKSSASRPQPHLLRLLRKTNDPYPFLPAREPKLGYLRDTQRPYSFTVSKVDLKLPSLTQASFAEALSQLIDGRDGMEVDQTLGAFVNLLLPSSAAGEEVAADTSETIESARVDGVEEESPVEANEMHPDVPKLASPKDSTHSPASYHSAPDEIRPEIDATEIRTADQDEAVPENSAAVEDADEKGSHEQLSAEMRLPTRKRSSTAAGNEEPESRTKSKRLRARESLLEIAAQEEEAAQENEYYLREQLAVIEHDDTACLGYVRKLLSKCQVSGFFDSDSVRDETVLGDEKSDHSSTQNRSLLLDDMKKALFGWTEETSSAILSGHGSREVIEKSGGLSLFQRHLKPSVSKIDLNPDAENEDESLAAFCHNVQQFSPTVIDTATSWLMQLLVSKSDPDRRPSSYLKSRWPAEVRKNTIRILLRTDAHLQHQLVEQLRLIGSSEASDAIMKISGSALSVTQAMELVQTVFELYLDEYHSMTGPESQSSDESKAEQVDRLQRWSHVATDLMQICSNTDSAGSLEDSLILRFLMASVSLTGLLAGNDKSHVLACLADVRAVLILAGSPTITLPNNRAIPQVSTTTIDQETSRLSTLDFFNSVFDSEKDDPVVTIMKLEPILESDQEAVVDASQQNQITELRAFLDSGDASLKLFLWRRLQNAYAAISYTPKVVSCLLRSLETIMQEIQSEIHRSQSPSDRQNAMFRWLRDADEIMAKVLSRVPDEGKAFEILDERHLQSSLTAIASMLELLYEFVKFDDSIRVGQTPSPSLRTSSAMKSFERSKDKMRDAFVRGWTLMFHLMKEATLQLPDQFDRPVDQLAEYLRLVHNMLGHRQYCKNCNKLFVKLARSEMLSIRSDIDYSEDVAQILYDMYQIKLGVGFGDANHGCSPDPLGRDKDTAFSLVPVIMTYARKLNMRDLIKSELKNTIEKIQQTLGQVKATPPLSSNKKMISGLLKSPINPQEVYRSLKGLGNLLTKEVSGDYAKVAAQGWYQMLGRMSLAKYKSIKRVNPTPTDDLDTAATFLRLDLEHNVSNWETWYRLAQVFDAKIEDSLIWNSLKLNDSRAEIATLERSSINAYTMAIASAMRNANDSTKTVQDISDMFSEFAFRLYASSRPPLNMEAFSTEKHMRHLSSSRDQSMSKAPFIIPFRPYAVWGFAAYLLQRKFASGQKEWLCYYTLGKCFWKMYQSADNARAKKPVTIEDVLEAFVDAVELVPKKEKSTDYILEPHYKLVSVVYKMVRQKLLPHVKGVEYLQATHFARGVHLSEDEEGPEWEAYILKLLKKLGTADKSNWHHRIIARAAHVLYDDEPNVAGALGAKHQFTQQIFTKTMTMQVWKPEHERPGRHYVYTGAYLKFFVHLLDQLNDRASLEQLIRRIRRKTTDFLDHPKIWEETALTYVRLLRRVGKVPEGRERAVFDKISYDEFAKVSEKVERWAHDPEDTSPFQDIVQDAIELKKLNNSLMKGPAIDDLIGDAYACMYEAFVSQQPAEEAAPAPKAALPLGTFINMNTDIVPTGDDNLDRMRLNNLLLTQVDGVGNDRVSVAPPLGLGLQTPPAVATPPLDPVRIPTPSKPGRTKTITRREVQRKAEACLVKPPPIKTPTLARRPFVDLSGARRDSTMSNAQEDTDNDKLQIDDGLPGSSRVSSRRPSMSQRDSAEPEEANVDGENDENDNDNDGDGEAEAEDDESELSEIDNDADDEDDKGASSTTGPRSLLIRKRKAEDDPGDETMNTLDEGEEGEGIDDEEADDDGDEDENENEDDVDTRDTMDVDVGAEEEPEPEPEDSSAVEIQDSQEPPASPPPLDPPAASTPPAPAPTPAPVSIPAPPPPPPPTAPAPASAPAPATTVTKSEIKTRRSSSRRAQQQLG